MMMLAGGWCRDANAVLDFRVVLLYVFIVFLFYFVVFILYLYL